MNINDITNPAHPLYHKDYAKLRGLSGLFVLQVCQTPLFKVNGATSATAIHIVKNMKVSLKNGNYHVSGKACLRRISDGQSPGDMWISAGEFSHPARVAQVIIHEMIHSCFGLEHGVDFNRKMIQTVNECFPSLQYFPPARRSHRYDADWELIAAMHNKGIFDEWNSAQEHHVYMEIAKRSRNFLQFQPVCFNTTEGKRSGRIVRRHKHTYIILTDGGEMFEVARQFVAAQ
jgi:hypothetical protein